MFFRIDGDDAKAVFEAFNRMIATATKTLETADKALLAVTKKWEWEANEIEARVPVTDEEIKKQLDLQKLEFDARLSKAKADMAEGLVRQRRASLQQANLNRAIHKPHGSATRTTPERRSGTEVKLEGKKEGQSLTHSLSEKLQQVVPKPS